jgi:hypothetical protein
MNIIAKPVKIVFNVSAKYLLRIGQRASLVWPMLITHRPTMNYRIGRINRKLLHKTVCSMEIGIYASYRISLDTNLILRGFSFGMMRLH